jgi:hypothetical protein
MTNKEIFKIWAPYHKKWVDWVRPVPFITIDNNIKKTTHIQPVLPCLSFLDNEKNTAIIIDLPNAESIDAGILLAQEYGYRPIPIYNGTTEQSGSKATTDNHTVVEGLIWGASMLKNIEIKDDAPPAFLTDTNRLQRHRTDTSVFDNSWDVYHQDLPTENYFLQNGITQILVISNKKISRDLRKIFSKYPKKKIQIFWSDGYDTPKLIQKGKYNDTF